MRTKISTTRRASKMNRDKRSILFSKVKRYASYRKKELRFNINPQLDREECLKEDLKLLKTIHYAPLTPQESEVLCESYHKENPPETVVFTEAQIWSFVYSDKWADFSSLRVCEGRLMETMLYFLHGLVKQGALQTYKQAKFDYVPRPRMIPTKLERNDTPPQDTVPAKIKFTYYALDPNTNIKETKLQKSKLKKREVTIVNKQISMPESFNQAHSDGSFASASECGDSLQSIDLGKPFSQTSSNFSEGELHAEDGMLSPNSDSSFILKESNQSRSAPSFTVVDDPCMPNIPVGDGSFKANRRKKDYTGKDNQKCSEPSSKSSAPNEDTPSPQLPAPKLNENQTICNKSKENIMATGTSSGSALPVHSNTADEDTLPMSTSLQTNIGSFSTSFSKKVDIISRTTGLIRRASMSPEIMLESVVFETDYDANRKKKMSRLMSGKEGMPRVNEVNLPLRKQSRPYLQDPEEHVIPPEDEDQNGTEYKGFNQVGSLETYRENVQNHCYKGRPMLCDTCTCHIAQNESLIVKIGTCTCQNQIGPQKLKMNMKTNTDLESKGEESYTPKPASSDILKDSVYLQMIENLKHMHEHSQTQTDTSQNDSCSEDKYFVKNIKMAKTITRPGKLKQKPGKRVKNNHNKLFNDMISNYSVKLFKQKKKFEQIKSGIPINDNKDHIIQMMENFLEEKYLPRLQTPEDKMHKPIKLAPLRNAPKPSVTSLLRQIHHETLDDSDHDFFPQRLPENFMEMLMKACEDFLVRKEQVTIANCCQTVTSITINRKLPTGPHATD